MIEDQKYRALKAMSLIEKISAKLGTTSYIWGGFTIDIYKGQYQRLHHDIDYLTVNLSTLKPEFAKLLKMAKWQVKHIENGDISATKEGLKVHLGNISLKKQARWTHNGQKGIICFPLHWLRQRSVSFYGVAVHVVEPEFEYVIKENPKLLNEDWHLREKDLLAQSELTKMLQGKYVNLDMLARRVVSITNGVKNSV